MLWLSLKQVLKYDFDFFLVTTTIKLSKKLKQTHFHSKCY